MIYRVPCRSYSGYCLAEIVGSVKDLRGQMMFEVEALHGDPWDDWSHEGWCPTNKRRFYPEHLIPVTEEESIETAKNKHVSPNKESINNERK